MLISATGLREERQPELNLPARQDLLERYGSSELMRRRLRRLTNGASELSSRACRRGGSSLALHFQRLLIPLLPPLRPVVSRPFVKEPVRLGGCQAGAKAPSRHEKE